MDWTDRFWAKVEKTDDCWLWTGAKVNGYGRLKVAGRTHLAHRLSFALHHGPSDRRLFIRHTCDNPPCVNPAHLVAGTPEQNSRDMVERGRACFGEKQWMSKLTEADVRTIRTAVADGAIQRHLAARYGVSVAQLSRIVSGSRWGHLREAVI